MQSGFVSAEYIQLAVLWTGKEEASYMDYACQGSMNMEPQI